MFSSLTSIINRSPNHSGKRTHKLDTFTPHCFVGQVTAKRGLEVFLPKDRQASCNYVIGYDGQIGGCVDEENRSWCTSSAANDQRAITVECASDSYSPWAFTPACYNALIKLFVDICKRYNKTKIIWKNDKNYMLNYEPKDNEIKVTVHRWYANKACPGDWMMGKMDAFVAEVQKQIGNPEPTPKKKLYHVQVGAYKVKRNADNMEKKLKADGYDTYMVKVGDLYKVQTGAFSKKENADRLAKELKDKGYATYVTLY